ncbi:autoinducer binding domain-containing protein [Erwinia sp. BNK-24-b]|uniref:LuxR family transcriptional regulator n=1 Tax=Erwinia TaxID=551 RepID=UPI001FEF5D28|nr:LuxR family transcriptional regulator [Erwinia phyllosphaerae]MBV4366906.1 LuxR family transcriptional regulator [Erwinia phyllosphaerae]
MKKDAHVIQKYIETELARFGNFSWAYVVLEKKSMVLNFYATNYPQEWVQHYFDNNLQCTDPVVSTALKSVTPFAWNENMKSGNYHHGDDVFEKAAGYNIRQGYTFVLHDYNNNLVTLTLINDGNVAEEMAHIIKFHKGRLNLFLASLHEKYLSLASSVEENKSSPLALFTKRENAVLYWVSLGKTYDETGTILGIKTTTIKFHIANIVKKLGVTNARQAICLGVELQLVKPAD